MTLRETFIAAAQADSLSEWVSIRRDGRVFWKGSGRKDDPLFTVFKSASFIIGWACVIPGGIRIDRSRIEGVRDKNMLDVSGRPRRTILRTVDVR
jgi:hypothetical protein